MSPLLLILVSLALHLIGFALLFRAARRSRRHRPLPVIGSDPVLTERLRLRLNLNRSGCALVEVTVGIAFMIGFALLMIALMSDGPAN